MAKPKQGPAAPKAAPPARAKVLAASTEEGTASYVVTGPMRIGGLALQPGDEVQLTEMQAYKLAGFVEAAASEPD